MNLFCTIRFLEDGVHTYSQTTFIRKVRTGEHEERREDRRRLVKAHECRFPIVLAEAEKVRKSARQLSGNIRAYSNERSRRAVLRPPWRWRLSQPSSPVRPPAPRRYLVTTSAIQIMRTPLGLQCTSDGMCVTPVLGRFLPSRALQFPSPFSATLSYIRFTTGMHFFSIKSQNMYTLQFCSVMKHTCCLLVELLTSLLATLDNRSRTLLFTTPEMPNPFET